MAEDLAPGVDRLVRGRSSIDRAGPAARPGQARPGPAARPGAAARRGQWGAAAVPSCARRCCCCGRWRCSPIWRRLSFDACSPTRLAVGTLTMLPTGPVQIIDRLARRAMILAPLAVLPLAALAAGGLARHSWLGCPRWCRVCSSSPPGPRHPGPAPRRAGRHGRRPGHGLGPRASAGGHAPGGRRPDGRRRAGARARRSGGRVGGLATTCAGRCWSACWSAARGRRSWSAAAACRPRGPMGSASPWPARSVAGRAGRLVAGRLSVAAAGPRSSGSGPVSGVLAGCRPGAVLVLVAALRTPARRRHRRRDGRRGRGRPVDHAAGRLAVSQRYSRSARPATMSTTSSLTAAISWLT